MVGSYELVDYFDVWGNEEDGWEINNLSKEGEIVLEDFKPETIIESLKDFGFLSEICSLENVAIEWAGDIIEVLEKSNGKPLCSLREIVD
jgi:hypothetical protein